MTELDFDRLRRIAAEHRYPLLFATVSGAHLYGFPSRDSDVDIRGSHLLPVQEVVGLRHGPHTLELMWIDEGVELDLVTHDLAKFCQLLLGRNGNVLEMLLSPLVVSSSGLHAELIALAAGCLTKHHAHHYRGFAGTEWTLFGKSGELKPLLYTYRALLTGIYLMRTGTVNANLPSLSAEVREAPGYLQHLIAAKASGEHLTWEAVPDKPSRQMLTDDVATLQAALEDAQASSSLPERASAADALHDLVIRARLDVVGASGSGEVVVGHC